MARFLDCPCALLSFTTIMVLLVLACGEQAMTTATTPPPTATPPLTATMLAPTHPPTLALAPAGWLDYEFWEHADVEDVKALLDRGADVGVSDSSGNKPLHLAVTQSGNPAVIELLLNHGAGY